MDVSNYRLQWEKHIPLIGYKRQRLEKGKQLTGGLIDNKTVYEKTNMTSMNQRQTMNYRHLTMEFILNEWDEAM